MKNAFTWSVSCILRGWIPDSVNTSTRRFIKIFFLPFACVISAFNWFAKKILLPRIEIVITTRCNLRCKNCANLIPCYKNPGHIPLNELKKNADALFSVVHRAHEVLIMGGEPMLHPELTDIIKMLSGYSNFDKLLIITNGSIRPSQEMLDAMKQYNVEVKISGYSITDKKAAELINLLNEQNICYEYRKDMEWYDYGGFAARGRNARELRKVYQNCPITCLTYVQGQLHMCPRSGNGLNSGVLDIPKKDYVDFNCDISSEAVMRALKNDVWNFANLSYVNACQHCDAGCNNLKTIPAAIQM